MRRFSAIIAKIQKIEVHREISIHKYRKDRKDRNATRAAIAAGYSEKEVRVHGVCLSF
jgi:hypothetical protein